MLSTFTSIRVEHWGVAARSLDSATIRYPISILVRDVDVFVVDDCDRYGKNARNGCPVPPGDIPGKHQDGSTPLQDIFGVRPRLPRRSGKFLEMDSVPQGSSRRPGRILRIVIGGEPVTVDDCLSRLKERYDMVPTRRNVKAARPNLIIQGMVEPAGKRFLLKRAQE